ncbi:MAG: hypothetical protein ACHQK9_10505 [Reyranellales bacterium]
MRSIGDWLKILAILLTLQLPELAAAQTRSPLLWRIQDVMNLILLTAPLSRERDLAGELLLDYVRALDPKDADEVLINDLIFFLNDQGLRYIGARCLLPLDRQEIARKAIPMLLAVLPEENCKGVGGLRAVTGYWASEPIRRLLTDMRVEGRDWTSEKGECVLPQKYR